MKNKEIEDFYKMKTFIFILNKIQKCMKSKISSRIEDSWHFISFASIRNQPKVLISRDKEIFDFVILGPQQPKIAMGTY